MTPAESLWAIIAGADQVTWEGDVTRKLTLRYVSTRFVASSGVMGRVKWVWTSSQPGCAMFAAFSCELMKGRSDLCQFWIDRWRFRGSKGGERL